VYDRYGALSLCYLSMVPKTLAITLGRR
jgi:hypothetical protein